MVAYRNAVAADAELRLIDRDPEALIVAVDNEVIVGAIIVGCAPQPEWSRWVKPL
jgi:hypothetical protein